MYRRRRPSTRRRKKLIRTVRSRKSQYRIANNVLNKRSELKTRWGFLSSAGVPVVRFGHGENLASYRLLNNITKGTEGHNRVGDQIYVRGFRFNLEVVNYDTYNNFRILLVESRGRSLPSNGLDLSNEIFKFNAPDNTDAFFHLNAPVNNKYHKIIYDKKFTLYNKPTGQELATYVNTHKRLKISRKWNRRVSYLPSPDTTGIPNTNITLVLMSDSVWGPPFDDHPRVEVSSFEVFFNDM